MTTEQYRALKAKAGTEGLATGLLWIVAFATFMWQFKSAALLFVSMAAVMYSAVRAVTHLRHYVRLFIDGIGYGKAFFYFMSVFFYASLLLALAQWIYFQFLDNGYLLEQYRAQLTQPEFVELMKGVKGFSPEEIERVLKQFEELRPIDIALNIMSSNIVLSLLLSFPSALIVCISQPRTRY